MQLPIPCSLQRKLPCALLRIPGNLNIAKSVISHSTSIRYHNLAISLIRATKVFNWLPRIIPRGSCPIRENDFCRPLLKKPCDNKQEYDFWWLSIGARRQTTLCGQAKVTFPISNSNLLGGYLRNLRPSKCTWCTSLTQKEREFIRWRWDEFRTTAMHSVINAAYPLPVDDDESFKCLTHPTIWANEHNRLNSDNWSRRKKIVQEFQVSPHILLDSR